MVLKQLATGKKNHLKNQKLSDFCLAFVVIFGERTVVPKVGTSFSIFRTYTPGKLYKLSNQNIMYVCS